MPEHEPNEVGIMDSIARDLRAISAADGYWHTTRTVDWFVRAPNEVAVLRPDGSPNTPWFGITINGPILTTYEKDFVVKRDVPFLIVAAIASSAMGDLTERWRLVTAVRLLKDIDVALLAPARHRRVDPEGRAWAIGTKLQPPVIDVGHSVDESSEQGANIAFVEVRGHSTYQVRLDEH